MSWFHYHSGAVLCLPWSAKTPLSSRFLGEHHVVSPYLCRRCLGAHAQSWSRQQFAGSSCSTDSELPQPAPPTPLRIQRKQMAWELLQNVGRQKDESRWAGRGKRCWQAKWQQGCFPSRTSLHAARAGEGDASSVRRQVWATGSCCGLAGGMS